MVTTKESRHDEVIQGEELPEGWASCGLGEIVAINQETRNPAKELPDREFIYMDISSVEGSTGRIKEPEKLLGKSAPSRARRVIHTDDVIMSTVRPYLKVHQGTPWVAG